MTTKSTASLTSMVSRNVVLLFAQIFDSAMNSILFVMLTALKMAFKNFNSNIPETASLLFWIIHM